MTKPGTIKKAVAIATSLLLLGGFVAYRAGAFDSFMESYVTDIMGGSKTTMIDLPDAYLKLSQGYMLTPEPENKAMNGSNPPASPEAPREPQP